MPTNPSHNSLNIFVLDKDPQYAAEYHCDKHIPKMIVETGQLLSAAHHLHNSKNCASMYKLTHKGHPCTKWTADSTANYEWLYQLFTGLSHQFLLRRGKQHKSWVTLKNLLKDSPSIDCTVPTPFAQAMPDDYKHTDPVVAYRTYYIKDKTFATWTWPNSRKPYWYTV